MKMVTSPLCSFYKEELETYQHLFYECIHVKTFITNVKTWLDDECNAVCTINVKSLRFGLQKKLAMLKT